MGWIANRIKAEERKHSKFQEDWTKIAEAKIVSQIKAHLREMKGKVTEVDIGEYDKDISAFELMDYLDLGDKE